jgi:DNA-binding NarL/FixJ family response regulator
VRPAAPIRMVIVDDYPVIRDLLASWVVGDERFDLVGEAAGGLEALGLVGRLDPDAVLLDLHLPSLDGLELLRLLVQQHSGLVVVVLSGDEQLLHEATIHGASAVFAKGHELLDVFDAIAAGVPG